MALPLDGVLAAALPRAGVRVLASLRWLALASLAQSVLASVPASEAQLVALVAYMQCSRQ